MLAPWYHDDHDDDRYLTQIILFNIIHSFAHSLMISSIAIYY